MILAKGIGAALALAVMAGFVGQASAGLREYCDSYARDVANRKTNGGAEGGGTAAIIGGVGGTVLGAGVTNDHYKRAYANAYQRCVNNYEGARARDAEAGDDASDQTATNKKAAASEATDGKAAAGEATDDKVVASEATDKKLATSEVTDKKAATSAPTEKKVVANDATPKKVAANDATPKKVAANDATPKKVAANDATPKKVAANEATDKTKACARKYRSFDPQTGKYKSYTGVWRTCRL
jgi:hypothetical protein